jgi:hypothetical protein
MIDEDLTENHPRMVVPRWHSVPRTPRDLANFLAPVLKEASLIRLVDPYFEPRPDERDGYRATKWTRPLVAFYSQMRSAGNIEYHTLLHSKRPWNGKAWEQACCAELPHVLPAGMRLTVLLWEEKKPGLQFHARYIFTDRYAVLVDPGLDALVDGHGQTTNFGFLSEQDRQGLEEQFSHDATTYRLLAKHEILGVGDCLGEAHLRGLR